MPDVEYGGPAGSFEAEGFVFPMGEVVSDVPQDLIDRLLEEHPGHFFAVSGAAVASASSSTTSKKTDAAASPDTATAVQSSRLSTEDSSAQEE